MFKSKNSGIKEKATAWLVTTLMKGKHLRGAGCGFKVDVNVAKNKLKK